MSRFFKANIELGGSSKGATAAIGRTSKALGGLDTAQARYNSHLSRSNGLLSSFGSAMGGVGMLALANDTLKASFAMDSFNTLLEPEQLEHLTEIAGQLGISFEGSARAFALLNQSAKGTVLEGEGIVKVFDGIAVAARAVNLSADDMRGIFRAVEQMMNKGTVQAEELRGQLAERLPGAFQMSAKAMGVTTTELSKMLETGDVIATELLPKLAEALQTEFGDKAVEMAGKGAAALQNFKNELFFLQADIMSGELSGAFVDVMDTFTDSISAVREDTELLMQVLEGMAVFMGGKMVMALLLGERGLITKAAATVKAVSTNQSLILSNASVAASDVRAAETALIATGARLTELRAKSRSAAQSWLNAKGTAVEVKAKEAYLTANTAVLRQEGLLIASQRTLTASMTARTVATKAATVAQRSLSGAMMLMGGWPGLALAAGAGLYYLLTAEEELTENTKKFLGSLENVDFSLDQFGNQSAFAEMKLRDLSQEIADTKAKLSELRSSGNALDKFLGNLAGVSHGSARVRGEIAQLVLTLNSLEEAELGVSDAAQQRLRDQQATIASLDALYTIEIGYVETLQNLRTQQLEGMAAVKIATKSAIAAANEHSKAESRTAQEKEIDKRVTAELTKNVNANSFTVRQHITQLVADEAAQKEKIKTDKQAATTTKAATKALKKYNTSLEIEIAQLSRVSGGLGDTSDLNEKIAKAIAKHGVALDSLTVIQLKEIDRLEKLAEWLEEDAELYSDMMTEIEDAEKWVKKYNAELDASIAIAEAKIKGDEAMVEELETLAEAHEIYTSSVEGSSVATEESIAADIRKKKSLEKMADAAEEARDAISDIFDNLQGNLTTAVENFFFQATFGAYNLKSALKDTYDDDLANLKQQLNSKKITQREFDQERIDLERDYQQEIITINESAWDTLKNGAILSVQKMLAELFTEWVKSKFLAAISGFSMSGSVSLTGGATNIASGASGAGGIAGAGASVAAAAGQSIGAIGGAAGAKIAAAISGGADSWFAANAAFGAGNIEAGISGLTWAAEGAGAAMSEAAIGLEAFGGAGAQVTTGTNAATAATQGLSSGWMALAGVGVFAAGAMLLHSQHQKKLAETAEEVREKFSQATDVINTGALTWGKFGEEGLIALGNVSDGTDTFADIMRAAGVSVRVGADGMAILGDNTESTRQLAVAYNDAVSGGLNLQMELLKQKQGLLETEGEDRAEILAIEKKITAHWQESVTLINSTKFDKVAAEFAKLAGVAESEFKNISADGIITADELASSFQWSADKIDKALGGAASLTVSQFLKIANGGDKAASSLTKSFDRSADDIADGMANAMNDAQGSIDSLEGKDVTINVHTNHTSSGGGDRDAGKAGGTPAGGLIVPAGFPNDSYTVGLTSGERYTVDTEGQQRTRTGATDMSTVEALLQTMITQNNAMRQEITTLQAAVYTTGTDNVNAQEGTQRAVEGLS